VVIGTIPYAVDKAIEVLAPFKHVITVCAKPPIAFFAYPDKSSELYSPSARVHTLANMDEDGIHALEALARALDANHLSPVLQPRADLLTSTSNSVSTPSDQVLTVNAIDEAVARLMPDDAIVINESITSGHNIYAATRAAAPHDWLEVCGGSIGDGLPLATGAAIACPDRKVLTLQADGSGMYTVQALWTQARESLDITTIIYANRCYAILKHELDNVQADSGEIAQHMMEINRPQLDWVSIAKGMGVDAVKASTVAEFNKALETGLTASGPFLIEAVI
jgi:acetolactate synthase-1/2/3 large subunit